MKKNLLKRSLALFLGATLLASSVVACSSTSENTSSSSSDSSAVETDDNFNATGLPIVNEPVTYHVVVQQNAASEKTYDQKYIFQMLEEETNVIIEFEEVASTAWAERINLMVSTGQTPDALMGGDMPDIAAAIDAGLVLAIDDYLEYLPTLQLAYEEVPAVKIASSYEEDGLHYFYPAIGYKPFAECRAPLFINQTWLDYLGLDMPTTTEEFYEVLVAFRDGDPNQNGIADEIPFCCIDDWFGGTYLEMFGAWDMMGIKNPVETTVRDGVLDFNPVTDNYREALEYFSLLYNEGLMGEEALTVSSEVKSALAVQTPGIYGAAIEWNIVDYGENADDFVVMEPLIGPDGAQKWTYNDVAQVTQAMVIFEGCENPEILLRYMDYANTGINEIIAGYGEIGYLVEVDEDAQTYIKLEDYWIEQGESLEMLRVTEGMQNNMGISGLSSSYLLIEPEGSSNQVKTEWSEMYAEYMWDEYYPASSQISVVSAESQTIALLETELTTYLAAFRADAILNGITDESWAAHLTKCEALEYETIVAYYQGEYDKNMAAAE